MFTHATDCPGVVTVKNVAFRIATAGIIALSIFPGRPESALAEEAGPNPAATAPMTDQALQVTRSLLVPAPPGRAIMRVETCYLKPAGGDLIQEYSELEASDTFGANFVRFSSDNGKSWSEFQKTYDPEKTAEGVHRQGEVALLLNPKSGSLIRIFNQHIYPEGTHSRAVVGLTKIQYQISRDSGKTYSEPRQIIADGCTPEAWAPGVKYGVNSAMISFCAPFFDRRGRIILPTHRFQVGDPSIKATRLPIDAGCFIGEVKEDGSINWQLSKMIEADTSISTRGFCEPAIAELADGRFLMILRGSNVGKSELPSRKWISLSDDGGLTWSPIKPWTYDNGENFFSPASGSRLIRSSKNGGLYWIGNITPRNCDGNWPRYPLVIGKVDEATGLLLRDSISPIADRQPGVSARLQYSNFKAHEDRKTGDFCIAMSPLFETGENDLTAPAYEFRVKIP